MTLYGAIRTKLLSDAAVTAVVGQRIWAMTKQQETAGAYILLQMVSGTRLQNITGSSKVARSRIQLTCVSDNFDTAVNLRELVIASLYPFSGTMGGVGGIAVQATELALSTDRFDADVSKMLAMQDIFFDYETAA